MGLFSEGAEAARFTSEVYKSGSHCNVAQHYNIRGRSREKRRDIGDILQSRQTRRPAREVNAFERQKLLLGDGAARGGEAADLVAGDKDAMAWNDDRHGILAHRLADLARIGAAERARQFAVSRGVAPADTAQRLIKLLLEFAQRRQMDGHAGEVDLLAGEVPLHVGDQRLDGRWRIVGRRAARALLDSRFELGAAGPGQ